MCADIYRTPKRNTFLLLPRGQSLGIVPQSLIEELGPPIFLKTRELCDPLLCIETDSLQQQLATRGFAVREL